jgi:hypothetical protein
MVPLFTRTPKGIGLTRRQCTGAWKINPVRKEINKYLRSVGLPVRKTKRVMWLGITTDEWQRIRDSSFKNTTNAYPLLDKGMSRQDCIDWLLSNSLEVPPKSACVMCPYQNKGRYKKMVLENGYDWKVATYFDEEIRLRRNTDGSLNSPMYVHPSCVPLKDISFEELEVEEIEAPCGEHCFL